MSTLTLTAEQTAALGDVAEGDTKEITCTSTGADGSEWDVSGGPDEEAAEGDQSGAQGGQSEAETPEAMPAIPGPVRSMLGKRK